MKQRVLGRTGIQVSELCFGTLNFGWNVDEPQAWSLLDAFKQAGGNFIQASAFCEPDGALPAVAEASEEYVGRWWRERRHPRESLFLATRIVIRNPRPHGAGALEAYIRRCCESSLQRFRTTHLDLLLIEWNEHLPLIDDILFVLSRLRRAGLVRYIGASGFPAWRLMESIHRAIQRDADRFEVLQADFSALSNSASQREQLQICRDYRLGFLARSPLAGGLLASAGGQPAALARKRAQWLREQFPAGLIDSTREDLAEAAARRGATMSEAALAWVLTNPAVTAPVLGVGNPDHLAPLLRVSDAGWTSSDFNPSEAGRSPADSISSELNLTLSLP